MDSVYGSRLTCRNLVVYTGAPPPPPPPLADNTQYSFHMSSEAEFMNIQFEVSGHNLESSQT
jgi:hypothetical protein